MTTAPHILTIIAIHMMDIGMVPTIIHTIITGMAGFIIHTIITGMGITIIHTGHLFIREVMVAINTTGIFTTMVGSTEMMIFMEVAGTITMVASGVMVLGIDHLSRMVTTIYARKEK